MFGSYGSRPSTQQQPLFMTPALYFASALLAIVIGVVIPSDTRASAFTLLLFLLLTLHACVLKIRQTCKIPDIDFIPVPIVAAGFALPTVFAPLIMLMAALMAEIGTAMGKKSVGSIISVAAGETGQYGLPAVIASGVYRATGERLPLSTLDLHNLIRLGGVLLIYNLTYGILHRYLHPANLNQGRKLFSRHTIRFASVQLVLLILAALIALYHFNIGEPGYFALFIALIGIAMWLIQSIGIAQITMSRHLHEMASLNRIGQAMTSNLSLDDLLATIYAQVQTLCKVSTFYIAFYDKEQVSFPFVVQKQQPCTWTARPAGNGLPEYAIRTRQTLVLLDHMEERLATLGLETNGEEKSCYLGVPLILGDDVLGVMALQPDRCEDSCIQTNRELFLTVAAQAAIAIRNARLFQETEAVTSELYNLVETSRQFTASLNLNQVAETVIHGLKNLISIEHGSLCLWHMAQNMFQLLAHASETSARLTEQLVNTRRTSIAQTMADHTARTLALDDPETGKEWSALVFPLVIHEQGIGMAVLWDHNLQTLSPHERRLLDGMLHQAATALQNALIFSQTDETLQDRVIALSAIEVISRQMSATLDIKMIINDVLAAAISATGAAAGSCALLITGDQFEVVAHLDAQGSELNVPFPANAAGIERWVIRRVLHTHQPVVIPDIMENPEHSLLPEGMRSELCVPIRREDRTIGVLNLQDTRVNAFTESDVRFISTLAEHAAIAIENARLYEEVRSGRDQLQAILDSTQEGMLLFDSRGRLLRANATAEAMLEQDLQPFLGENFTIWLRASGSARFQMMTGYTLPQLVQYVHNIFRDPSQVTSRQFEQRKGEDVRYIAETGLPVLDQQGRTVGWLLVWRDVTEERELNALREELSSMIVHDLRSPLTSILSSLTMLEDLLSEGETNQETFSEVIRVAQNSGENMLSLVQSLLDIARLEQQSVVLEYQGYSLSEAVDYACGTMLTLAAGADIALDIQVSDDLPPVLIDAEKVQRVFINLLDNALRYTPYGGKITISARMSEDENKVVVCVADSGPGIPLEARSDIFSKFVQSDRKVVRGHKGTGLGLTFCKLAIEAHGGRIWVEDASGGGAAFYFTIPIVSTETNSR